MYQFPGVDVHDLNLDWLLEEMKSLREEWEEWKREHEESEAEEEDENV